MGKSIARPPRASVYENEKSADGLNLFPLLLKPIYFWQGEYFFVSTQDFAEWPHQYTGPAVIFEK